MLYTCPALLANVGRGSQRRPALASSVGSIGQYATPRNSPYLPLCATIRRYPIRHYPQHRKTPYSVAGAMANVGREQCRAMLGSVGQPAPDVGRERRRAMLGSVANSAARIAGNAGSVGQPAPDIGATFAGQNPTNLLGFVAFPKTPQFGDNVTAQSHCPQNMRYYTHVLCCYVCHFSAS